MNDQPTERPPRTYGQLLESARELHKAANVEIVAYQAVRNVYQDGEPGIARTLLLPSINLQLEDAKRRIKLLEKHFPEVLEDTKR